MAEEASGERPDEICVLVHTANMQIVMEWRALDVWNACERRELTLDECIDLIDGLRRELEVCREHGGQAPKLQRKRRSRE